MFTFCLEEKSFSQMSLGCNLEGNLLSPVRKEQANVLFEDINWGSTEVSCRNLLLTEVSNFLI